VLERQARQLPCLPYTTSLILESTFPPSRHLYSFFRFLYLVFANSDSRLINILKQAGQPVPEDLLKFGTTVKKKLHPVYGAFYREVDTTNVPAKIVFDD